MADDKKDLKPEGQTRSGPTISEQQPPGKDLSLIHIFSTFFLLNLRLCAYFLSYTGFKLYEI